MYQIIKNADLPAQKRTSPEQYPLSLLQVGDGFDIPNDLGTSAKGYSRRLTSIKGAVAKFRHQYNQNARFVIGPRADDPRFLRCVRIR
jgi:hypothetical protein